MLSELHVRDLALIEETWLEFGPGMTVLTGETGAGKTVLLGALKLLLGERADATSVRAGAAEALVEGSFAVGDDEVIVRRRVTSDGRSRCVLDGEMATVGALAQRVGPLVDLHGQHDHQALLSVATHAGYLDRWAGEPCLRALSEYRVALSEWRQSVAELDALEHAVSDARLDIDRLRFTVDEIGRIDPKPGEDEELQGRLPALMHAEKLSEAAAEVAHLLRGEGGAVDRIAEARAALARVAGIDPALDSLAERLAEVETLSDDVGSSARTYRDSIEYDPHALDAVQARMAELSGLVRRYGPTLTSVIAAFEEAQRALDASSLGDEALVAAREREKTLRNALESSARELSTARRSAAPDFAEELTEASQDLAMEGSAFEVTCSELPFDAWGDEGPMRIEFLYSPAPGQPARPLARIASGGEISRVMLALKGVLGSADSVGTLIFDEIDAGVGGATATAVGRRLASLAQTHQVVVVTHLAQVAAFADTQFVVRKMVDGDSAATTVVPVEGEDRVAELARMIAGTDTEAGLIHAAELLDSARSSRG